MAGSPQRPVLDFHAKRLARQTLVTTRQPFG
jgi:hypothetical protein